MAEKSSFVLYTRYREQINMLNDEQAGQLMKAIFDYQAMGEVVIEDPVVAMLWSVMKQQLDADNQKYQEVCTKRKEAGAKGGKSKNSKSKNKEAKQANAIFAKQTEANQADNDIEYDIEIDNENDIDISSPSNDYEDIYNNKTSSGGGSGAGDARKALPVDNAPLEVGADEADDHPICISPEVQSFASNLFVRYRDKQPTKADMQRIIEYSCRPEYDNTGNRYAMLDKQKAELLQYAFEQATENGNTSWNYIHGIYRKFRERGIENLEDAYGYAYQREQGKTVDGFMDTFYGG